MSMYRKSIVAMLVTLLMLVGVLSACGSDKGNNNSNNAEKEKENTAQTEKQVVKLYHYWPDEELQWDLIYPEFQKEYPDIEVEQIRLVELDSRAYAERINFLAASGDELGVILTTDYANYAESGLTIPLNSYMEAEGKQYDDVYSVSLDYKGSFYGLPTTANSFMILLNKDALDEAGLEVPTEWTWDEFREYAKALTHGEGASKHYGTYFHTWQNFFKPALYSKQENNNIFKEDGTSNMDDPAVAKSLELRYQMEYEDKSAVPYSISFSQKLDYRDQFFTGKVSMLPAGYWLITETGGTEKFPANFTTAFAPWPKSSASDPNGYTFSSPTPIAITKNAKNKEASYKFIRWYTTKGVMLQKYRISVWNDADKEETVNNILEKALDPSKIDRASLLHSLNVTKGFQVMPPPYEAELDNAFVAEAQKYLLGSQTLEATMENAKESMELIIKANKQ